MAKIGVKNLHYKNFLSLKTEVLYFDKISVELSNFHKALIQGQIQNQFKDKQKILEETNRFYSDIEYLIEKNIILEHSTQKVSGDFQNYMKSFIPDFELDGQLSDMNLSKELYEELITTDVSLDEITKISSSFNPLNTEFMDAVKKDIEFVEISDKKKDSNQVSTSTEVFDFIIKNYPIPNINVSWEKILDFKSDPDSRIKSMGLSLFLRKISNSEGSIHEIKEQIEYNIRLYEKHLELHKLKYKRGMIEVLVISTAQVIEDILTFKFGKLAKSLFDINRKNIDFLIAENKAPGKEVAYISKIKSNLQYE